MEVAYILVLVFASCVFGQDHDGIEALGHVPFDDATIVSSTPIKYRANLITKGQVFFSYY